jgi:hypothetical protein
VFGRLAGSQTPQNLKVLRGPNTRPAPFLTASASSSFSSSSLPWLFSLVGVNFGRVRSSRGLDRSLDLSLCPRPLAARNHDTERVPSAMEKRKKCLFFCSLTDVQVAINPRSAR